MLKNSKVQKELERIADDNALAYNITPEWVKDQCYICYDRAKTRANTRAKTRVNTRTNTNTNTTKNTTATMDE